MKSETELWFENVVYWMARTFYQLYTSILEPSTKAIETIPVYVTIQLWP